MAFVFKHPSLTALELLWRWLAAAPLLFLAWHTLAPTLEAIPLNTTALQSMTFFEPVRSAGVFARQILPFRSPIQETGKWYIPVALLTWTAAATLGRVAILRRADRLWSRTQASVRPGHMSPSQPERAASTQPELAASTPSSRPERAARSGETPVFRDASAEGASLSRANLTRTALLTFLRALAFLFLLALWAEGLLAAVRSSILHRLYAGAEPNLVLLTAQAVVITLAAFLLWSTTVWLLDLRLLRPVTELHPDTNHQTHQLRSKLIETNLVMGIVRVILLVLALTFSASPLPFQSRDTQAYINVWWVATAIFYIFSSDFFHVVRRVTYLRLLQSVAAGANASAPHAS